MKEEIRQLLKSQIEDDVILGIILWVKEFGLSSLSRELYNISIKIFSQRIWLYNKEGWVHLSYKYKNVNYWGTKIGSSYEENLKSFEYFKETGHRVIEL